MKIICDAENLIQIAEAIRTKTDDNYSMTIFEMPEKIQLISSIDFVTLTFPETNFGDTIYYTNQYGEFASLRLGTSINRTINVMKNTIVCSNEPTAFDNKNIYLFSENNATMVKIGSFDNATVIIPHNNIVFGYSDKAPI